MSSINIVSLVSDMQTAATGVLNADVTTLRGFASQQLTAIAKQSDLVAAGIVDGSIGPDLHDYFLDSLEEMIKSFANTLSGLVAVMIEELWNALVKVVWSAINTVTGLALAVP